MAVYQSFNPKIKAWVKFRQFSGKRPMIIKVKKRLSKVPFKDIKMR